MIRFSAHIGYLFAEMPLAQRVAAAAKAGFEAVEHPAPYDIPAPEMAALLRDNGVVMAQMTSGLGGAGEKGLASLPGRETEFREGYARGLDYAETVDCPVLHAMAGIGGDRATYLRNLDVAQRLCEGRGVDLLIEAICPDAVPGYHLCHIDDMLALAQARGLRVLVDSYHAAMDARDPAEAIRRAGPSLGHVHIADCPGRHQPGSGVLDFPALLTAVQAVGFSGAVGFEYLPRGADHLGWLPEWQALRDDIWKGQD